jgi:bacillolysin
MGRVLQTRGQTSVEYLGVLFLIAAIVFTVSRAGVGDRVAGETERLICQIAGGTDCGTPGKPGESEQDEERQDSGRADREIFDADCDNDLPGDRVRGTGEDPSGNAEADTVFTNLGLVYDYYLDTFGRDSYDGDGTRLTATVNYCEDPGVRFRNAFWNGDQMVFGEGYANALDITAHELTHAVTEHTADLEYSCQSGALNEAISDIFASNIDTEDWQIGEDLPDGAIRDMSDPSKGHPPQPAHVDDYVVLSNDRMGDWGGVHYNSGIPNYAYYLMVQDIGRDPAQQIIYRALTEELESDSDFEDFRSAALESAEELYGADSPEYRGVDDAFAAVGLDGTWEAPDQPDC